jgi:aminopeptidase-like protein
MNKGEKIFELIERLYPLNRSITGNGVRETLKIISELIPLEIREVPSGSKVLDWEIPPEWNIRDAWIKDSNGNKVLDFNESNLHVLNYSLPIHKKVSLEELRNHLFTLEDHPEWIPYRTSYYNRNWGFCMAYNSFKKLEEGIYEAYIDAELKNGSLTYGEYYIKGQVEDEILISVHVCHPSLANDNLSGIGVAAYLAKHLSNEELKYSYRFLFIPGTIGSITWLSLNEKELSKIKYGLVLTLLGDKGAFNYKKTRTGNEEIDKIVNYCLEESGMNYNILEYYPYGYDERQYCSPGFDLPVGRLSRSNHGEFPEYHTSADNLEFIKTDKLEESFDIIMDIFKVLEKDKKFINMFPKGEPQLGKRGLFKKIGGQSETKKFQMALLWILSFSDGKHSLVDISIKSGIRFDTLELAVQELLKTNLIK